MFYSHSLLARKSALGIVWCAAHLQHRLKKSQYISTSVPSTVERILYPEVPIALRLYGHLLLGVVRIYSKQVEYLYEDCNVIRITINRVFTSASVNLPEDATHATYHSVTLPGNFELDALELDGYDNDWGHDSHIKDQEDITLTDQIPTGNDPYIAISFDEHESTLPSTEQNLGSEPVPMEEDVPAAEVDVAAEPRSSPSTQGRTGVGNVGTRSPQELPSFEIMRDAGHGYDFTSSPILPDRAEPDKVLEEQINKDKGTYTPRTEEVPFPGGSVMSTRSPANQPSSAHLGGSPMLFDRQSTEFKIQPTPPVVPRAAPPVPKPQARRKRKQFFDESIILSNRAIQRGLDDTSDIRRVRRNCPSSSLAIWKRDVRLRLRKDGLFVCPFLSGTCADLQDIYKEDAVSVKFPPIPAEVLHQEAAADQPSASRHGDEMEIETLRDIKYASPDRHMPDFSTVLPSPSERGYSTPQSTNFGIQSERVEATEGDEVLPTAGTGVSSGIHDSEIRTPDTFYGKGLQTEHTELSDIPELVASPGELGFLEQDDISPSGSQGTPQIGVLRDQITPELHLLSSRTRALAQYLKRQSPATPVPGSTGEPSEDLSLNKILEGKTRKICARMFYETLVLKSYDLVDVQQKAPYDDITLKPTPKLSKENFSS